MDPDKGLSVAPLLAIKITTFADSGGEGGEGGGGGTCIGILTQHHIADAQAVITLMKSWSFCYSGKPITSSLLDNRDLDAENRKRLDPEKDVAVVSKE